jgi:hypothetical protein
MTPHDAERLSKTAKLLRSSLLIVLQHVDELSRLADEVGKGIGSSQWKLQVAREREIEQPRRLDVIDEFRGRRGQSERLGAHARRSI